MNEIEIGKWCIFKGANFYPIGIGMIDIPTETNSSIRVIYFEGQSQKEFWEKKYLEIFFTPEKAIEVFAKKTGLSLEKIESIFLTNFPETILRK